MPLVPCKQCLRYLSQSAYRARNSGGYRKVCKECEATNDRARRKASSGERRLKQAFARSDKINATYPLAGDVITYPLDVLDDLHVEVTEDQPALDLEKLSDDDKTAQYVAIIPEVARAEGVEPCDVTWAGFRKYTKFAWGESNVGVAMRHIPRVGGFNAIRDAHFPPSATVYQVEKREILELAKSNRAEARKDVRDSLLIRQLDEVLQRAPIKIMPAEGYARKFSDGYEGKRQTVLIMNDDHYAPGCDLPGYDEAGQCRRTAKVCQNLLEFKDHYRERTEARIVINGDMIENWLHGPRWAHPSIQAISAGEKYSQVIRHAAAEYPIVNVLIVPGNHDRDIASDPKRATEEKARGYTTIIAGLIRSACRELKNVRIEVAAPEGFFDSFGARVMVTHGDTLFGQVSPRNLNTTAAAYVVERFNSAQGSLGPVKLVWLGHYHVDAHATTDNGTQIRFNPALTPSNEFARSVGAFNSFNGHYCYESVPGHVFGDNRLVRVTLEDSNDPALDGLILPFQDF